MGAWARFFGTLALCALLADQVQVQAVPVVGGDKAPVVGAAAISGGGGSATTTTMLDLKKYTDRIPNGNRLFDMQAGTQKTKATTKTKNSGAATTKTTATDTANAGSMTSSSPTTTGAFAKAFQAAGFQWTRALCEADSDGDGQTNGQELGDPCCSWTLTGNLAYISGASNPSDPTSKANPQMFGNIVCTRTKAAKIQETNRLKSAEANATTSATKESSGSDTFASKTKTNTTKTSSKNATRVDKSMGTEDSANSTSSGGAARKRNR